MATQLNGKESEREAPEYLDCSLPWFPRAVTEDHLLADRDHDPVPSDGYGDGLSDECLQCGLATTSDGKRHGRDEGPEAGLPPLPEWLEALLPEQIRGVFRNPQ